MKTILISVINFYQNFVSAALKNILGVNRMCKFTPTCSDYVRQMIRKHGAYGILLGAKRIGACR